MEFEHAFKPHTRVVNELLQHGIHFDNGMKYSIKIMYYLKVDAIYA